MMVLKAAAVMLAGLLVLVAADAVNDPRLKEDKNGAPQGDIT